MNVIFIYELNSQSIFDVFTFRIKFLKGIFEKKFSTYFDILIMQATEHAVMLSGISFHLKNLAEEICSHLEW